MWVCTSCSSGPSVVCNWLKKKSKECLNKSSLYQNVFMLEKCLRLGHHPVSKNKRPLDEAAGFFFLSWDSSYVGEKQSDEGEVLAGLPEKDGCVYPMCKVLAQKQ